MKMQFELVDQHDGLLLEWIFCTRRREDHSSREIADHRQDALFSIRKLCDIEAHTSVQQCHLLRTPFDPKIRRAGKQRLDRSSDVGESRLLSHWGFAQDRLLVEEILFFAKPFEEPAEIARTTLERTIVGAHRIELVVFADIGDLMLEMMSEGVETKASAGSTLAEQLAHVFVPGIEWHQQHPSLSRLSITVLMRAPSAIDADAVNISALESLLASVVKEGQATGEFRQDLDPEAAAAALLGLYFMSIHRWHRDGASSSPVDSFLRGLAVIMEGIAK